MSDSRSLAYCAIGMGVLRTYGLAGVLYDIEVMLASNIHDSVHVGTLTKQVHRHYDLRAWGNGFANRLHGDIHGVPIHIHYHGLQTQQCHHFGSSDKGEGRGNDLVTRLQAQCHQRYL